LKVSPNEDNIYINEGEQLPLTSTVCNKIDFTNGVPLVFENISEETCLDDIKDTLIKVNVNAYLGIPVILNGGETFGTLCAVHEKATKFKENSIKLIEKIAKMFSYYLELERMAYRDQLTGCYNRHFLEKYYTSFIADKGSILFLDLDGFKEINDNLGHETGDLVLKEVSQRIERVIEQKNLNGAIFRLGGDEFIIHLVGIYNEQVLSDIAEYLVQKLSSWDFQELHLTVSIGIVTYTNEKILTLNELLKKADNALYRAKASGKNTYKFF